MQKNINSWGVRPPPETREFLIYFKMKEIKLTQGKVALIDDEDYEYLNQKKWYLLVRGNNEYAINVVKENNKTKTTLMHRAILKYYDNDMDIDHIDRNGLNNQKYNLRIVSHSENLSNSRDRIAKGKIGLKRINKIWTVCYINLFIIKELRQFGNQKDALVSIRENRKYYLESV